MSKNPSVEREAMREDPQKLSKSLKMRAKPNWETMDADAIDTPDKLYIPPSMVPDGMSLQWVTSTVLGQDMATHRAQFERKGWTPVHQEDFDGQFDGKWMPKGKDGEITHDGLVLMARPKELTQRAELVRDYEARNQVARKEAEMRGGDVPGISLDANHPSALKVNKVGRSVERIDVPKE